MGYTMKTSEQLLNFLIGKVMQKTQGRANPTLVREMLVERLDGCGHSSVEEHLVVDQETSVRA